MLTSLQVRLEEGPDAQVIEAMHQCDATGELQREEANRQ